MVSRIKSVSNKHCKIKLLGLTNLMQLKNNLLSRSNVILISIYFSTIPKSDRKSLRQILQLHLIPCSGNFVERHRFCDFPKTKRKLCLSSKFPHQEIRWNYGILRNESQMTLYYLWGHKAEESCRFTNVDVEIIFIHFDFIIPKNLR